ncbi:MAG: hypoxanthine phosphoribosyltransferase [Bdellovibrionales bacterium]|jgi:hypoxanthine phosphoribosyltransferase|nr:hypoxanthine phosphoribosyltransferase [Bdellovibrionales bacterium]
MKKLRDRMIPFITAQEIDAMVSRLAEEIEADYEKSELVMICPLRGSVLFVADLMRKIHLPQSIDFVHLTSPKGKGVKIVKDINIDITGRHVLIVEEIIDAGRTLSFLEQRLLASRPASVKIVALLDKPARRELPIKPDYVGRTIEDRFVVGYGMDSEDLGRNYRDIYIYAQ